MDLGWLPSPPFAVALHECAGLQPQPLPSSLSLLDTWRCSRVCDPKIMKRDYVFIVNPNGANGKTAKQWKKIHPLVTTELGDKWNVREAFTSGPSHATEIAREAIREGAAAIIAVGGDGTLHEVVNGFFEGGKLVQPKEPELKSNTALGLIPLGTGSDFARTFNWKNNSLEAIARIGKGQRRKIDVGHVSLPGSGVSRYFLNVADVHLSAKGGYYAEKYKKLGTFCYVAGALHGFTSHKNQDVDIRIDDGEWQPFAKLTTMAVGNAKYYGGGMKITPTADPFSGNLEVVILQDFNWSDFAFQGHKLYKGSHAQMKNVTITSAHMIEIREHSVDQEGSVKQNIFIQADGEHLGFLPAKISVIPGAIDFLI